MEERKPIPPKLRKGVLIRDGYRCIKCGSRSRLELHHIVMAMDGRIEVASNLITLCHSCHKDAPSTPSEFLKWAIRRLPPEFDRSSYLTKVFVSMLFHANGLQSKIREAEETIDSMYDDFWTLYRDVFNPSWHLPAGDEGDIGMRCIVKATQAFVTRYAKLEAENSTGAT